MRRGGPRHLPTLAFQRRLNLLQPVASRVVPREDRIEQCVGGPKIIGLGFTVDQSRKELAAELWQSHSDENAVERFEAIGKEMPPTCAELVNVKTSNG